MSQTLPIEVNKVYKLRYNNLDRNVVVIDKRDDSRYRTRPYYHCFDFTSQGFRNFLDSKINNLSPLPELRATKVSNDKYVLQ